MSTSRRTDGTYSKIGISMKIMNNPVENLGACARNERCKQSETCKSCGYLEDLLARMEGREVEREGLQEWKIKQKIFKAGIARKRKDSKRERWRKRTTKGPRDMQMLGQAQ